MPCDKYMNMPTHIRLRLEASLKNNEEINPSNILYSLRHNPKTRRIEYQIPPSNKWIPGN